MKVKELIEELKTYDPDTEVIVGSKPVYYVEQLAGYWDGPYQTYETNEKGYIKKGRITRSGNKVVLYTWSAEDEFFNNPDFIIELDKGLGEHFSCRYEKLIKEWREQALRIKHKCELEHFQKWAKKARNVDKEKAKEFFNKNLSWKDKFPDVVLKLLEKRSYNDKREIQWDLEVKKENGELVLRREK